MNKVVQINLSGIVFTIDDDAYDTLKTYLEKVKANASTLDGIDEMMLDIEARVAEVLQDRLGITRKVVSRQDVDAVIEIMGSPEAFSSESEPASKTETNNSIRHFRRSQQDKVLGGVCGGAGAYFSIDPMVFRILFLIGFFVYGTGVLLYIILWIAVPEMDAPISEQPYTRKLFRDPETRVLGGVCSGIGAYLGIDNVWIRLLFLISFFFFGSGLFIYVVLWIVLPKAKTSTDRLRMKGEPVDLQNIERVFKNTASKAENTLAKNRNSIAAALVTLTKLVGVVIGVAFISIAVLMILGFSIGLLAYFSSFQYVLYKLGANEFHYPIGIGLGMFVAGVAGLFVIIGVRLMLSGAKKLRTPAIVFNVMAVVGIIVVFVYGFKSAGNVFQTESVTTSVLAESAPDTLYIQTYGIPEADDYYDFNWGNKSDLRIYKKEKQVWLETNVLVLESASADSIKMSITKSAKGNTEDAASNNAHETQTRWSFDGNILKVDATLFLDETDTYAFQQSQYTVLVPNGTILILDKKATRMLNRSRINAERGGETYKMTPRGPECLDCEKVSTSSIRIITKSKSSDL
jgi:phage shock protein PspC (stress-responsive transcriptional regulator)